MDAFEKERIADLELSASVLDSAERRKANDYIRQARRAAADLRKEEFDPAMKIDDLVARYKLEN